jgi:hypothetical protein
LRPYSNLSNLHVWDYFLNVILTVSVGQVLRPYSNLSNLHVWDYFLTEDLAHGPSYDIDIVHKEIRQNEDPDLVEGLGPRRRKVVNGCYDNIMLQQPGLFRYQFQVSVYIIYLVN